MGNFNKYVPWPEQLISLYALLHTLYSLTELKHTDVQPHNYFTKKSCPGRRFPMDKVRNISISGSTETPLQKRLYGLGIDMDMTNLMVPMPKLEVYELLDKVLKVFKKKGF